jgi:hypothetical protein
VQSGAVRKEFLCLGENGILDRDYKVNGIWERYPRLVENHQFHADLHTAREPRWQDGQFPPLRWSFF